MSVELSKEDIAAIIERIANQEINLSAAAREKGVTRPFLTRRIEHYFQDNDNTGDLENRYRLALVSNQTGKSLEDAKNYSKEEPSQEEIEMAKLTIMSGRYTLSQAAKIIGRTRDYLKRKILETISDRDRDEFLASIGNNALIGDIDEFESLSPEEKKMVIFDRLNERRIKLGKPQYKEALLEKKYNKLLKYFTETRNEGLADEEAKLSEDDVLLMAYETPTLLSSSLSNKIIPAVENLDSKVAIGPIATSKIIKEDSSIILSSISRTNLQVRILDDYGLLQTFMKKPRNFRTSPELIYAIAEFSMQEGRIDGIRDVMLSRGQLEGRYGMSQEDIKNTFDIRKSKYGNDEYFEK